MIMDLLVPNNNKIMIGGRAIFQYSFINPKDAKSAFAIWRSFIKTKILHSFIITRQTGGALLHLSFVGPFRWESPVF